MKNYATGGTEPPPPAEREPRLRSVAEAIDRCAAILQGARTTLFARQAVRAGWDYEFTVRIREHEGNLSVRLKARSVRSVQVGYWNRLEEPAEETQ